MTSLAKTTTGSPHATASGRCLVLAGRLRKPIPKDLLGCEAIFFGPYPDALGRLVTLAEIKFGSGADFVPGQAIDVTAKAGAVAQHILDLCSRVANRCAPSS